MLLLRTRRAALRSRAILAAILVAGPVACGDASTGPDAGATVASVVVAGVPASVLLVGDSVQLVATAVNATGGIVSDQQVTWGSSEPTIATVSTSGTVLALGSGTAVITASVHGHDGDAPLDIADGATFGTQGGLLTAAGGLVRLVVPAASLPGSTFVFVHPAANPPTEADARVITSTAYEIGPDGVAFQRGAQLTLTYDPAGLPTGLASESLQLYAQSGDGWAVIPGSTADPATHTVTGSIFRAGVYVLRSTPVAHIALGGAVAGGALYVGQTARIDVALLSSTGDSLHARSITWSSSAPASVTVDSLGTVTARALGSATITAATDGESDTTTVMVLSRPSAQWSGAADWTTYQGNARHSGYVEATLDPTVFRERWMKTPVPDADFFPPTAGGGRLYLAMSAFFTPQLLLALDPADGSVQWTRGFGSIFGINQPTYDDGTVYLTSGGHEDTFMWALNDADGSLRFRTPFDSQWEHWKAPVVVGSTIVTAGGAFGGVYGFDRATGAQTFFLAGPQVDGWAPAAAEGLLYVTGYVTGGGVASIDPADGTATPEVSDARLPSVSTPVLGDVHDLLTITGNRLLSVDLTAQKVAWERSGAYTGMPVVGNRVVYAVNGTEIAARNESDGTRLWSWTPPAPYTMLRGMVLTDNLLFVSTMAGGFAAAGATFAIDLASHRTVWSYPMSGDLALSSQGVLYIVREAKVAAISMR
jgi:outer membrane protein assembly factor BamB